MSSQFIDVGHSFDSNADSAKVFLKKRKTIKE